MVSNILHHPAVKAFAAIILLGTATIGLLAALAYADAPPPAIPGAPHLVGQTPKVLKNPRDLVLRNNLLYVTSFDNQSWFIFDVSDRTNPTIVAAASSTLSNPRGILLNGDYAYIADQNNGGNGALEIWNIANPASPTLVNTLTGGEIQNPGGGIIQGSYMYMNTLAGKTLVFDISVPTAPVQVGHYVWVSGAKPAVMYAKDNLLFVPVQHPGQSTEGLTILDISSSTNPTFVGSYTNDKAPVLVEVKGSIAYLVNEGGRIDVLDVSNPATPALLGTYSGNLQYGTGGAFQGTYSYVTSLSTNGLYELDLSNPANPIEMASTTEGLYTPSRVISDGRYLYVINRAGGTLVGTEAWASIFDTAAPQGTTTNPLTIMEDFLATNGTVNNALSVGQSLSVAGNATIGALLSTGQFFATSGTVSKALIVGGSLTVSGTSVFSPTPLNSPTQPILSVRALSNQPILDLLPNGFAGFGTSTPAAIIDGYQNTNSAVYMTFTNPNTGNLANSGFSAGEDQQYRNIRMMYVNSGVATSTVLRPNQGIITTGMFATNGLLFRIRAAAPIVFSGNSTEYMRISPAGFMGLATSSPASRLTVNGHIGTDGALPVVSSCGTSPNIIVGSTDTAGEITEGTSATGCTITFSASYARPPFCTVTSQSGLKFSYGISASAISITNIGLLSGTKINYHCIANDL